MEGSTAAVEDAVALVEYSPRLGEVPAGLVEGSTKSVEHSLDLVETPRPTPRDAGFSLQYAKFLPRRIDSIGEYYYNSVTQ